jgi:hypothetical protein
MVKVEVDLDKCSLLGMQDFYEYVVKLAGFEDEPYKRFNCTKIFVSRTVQDYIKDGYKNRGAEDFEIGMILGCYGPKIDETLKANEVSIIPGFYE